MFNRYLVLGLALLAVSCTSVKETYEELPAAFIRMEKVRKNKPVDFIALEKIYGEALADWVTARNPEADKDIKAALAAGSKGDRPHVQGQLVSKTLQLVFYGAIRTSLGALAGIKDKEGYGQQVRLVSALYRALAPTVLRRSQWIGNESDLDRACLTALEPIYTEYPYSRVTADAAAMLSDVLQRVFVLSVYYELEGIEKFRGANPKKCEEKQAEGLLFFRTVSHAVSDDALKTKLDAGLALPYPDMDIVSLRQDMKLAFPDIDSPVPSGNK